MQYEQKRWSGRAQRGTRRVPAQPDDLKVCGGRRAFEISTARGRSPMLAERASFGSLYKAVNEITVSRFLRRPLPEALFISNHRIITSIQRPLASLLKATLIN